MQMDGALSQVVSGFTFGSEYYLHYYENARSGPVPYLEATLGGTAVVPAHAVLEVGGSNPYHEIFSEVFVAPTTDVELDFIKSNPLGGDDTALIDNVAIVEIPPGTAPFIGANPQPVLASVGEAASFSALGVGSLPLSLQWLKNGTPITDETNETLALVNLQKPAEADYSLWVLNSFGSATSAVARLTVFEPIPDLFNTGVDGSRVALADGLVDPHYLMVASADTNNLPDAIVEDSTVFPIAGGPWLGDTAKSKWIGPWFNTAAAAVGLYTYRTVIDLTDRDPSTLVIQGQWATDNAGPDIRVNGVSTGNPVANGFNPYTPFAIYGTNANFVAGSNAIDFIVDNQAAIGYTGLRVEILRSNLRIPPGIKPVFTLEPVSQTVAVGDTVTFTADAQGTSPFTYQWNKDGAPLNNQNTLTLTLVGVGTEDSGNYTLTVSNSAGHTVSQPAHLCVCLEPIPGVFGTGYDLFGNLLPGGSADQNYILSVSADPTFTGPSAIVVNEGWPIAAGVWLLNGPKSKWIAPQADQSAAPTGGNAEGDYTYETAFDLTGYDLTRVTVSGGWAVDNTGKDILVNGQSTGITSAGFGSLTPFTLTSANGLVAGPNTIDFVMNNAPTTPNPTGLRVDLKGYVSLLPSLSITPSAQGATIAWPPLIPGQVLQQAPTPKGPWSDVTGASSGYQTGLTNRMQFYRVVIQ